MKRILLTGASGFVAAHVLDAFLKQGYFVRFTVRTQEKADQVLDANAQYRAQLEATIVPGKLRHRRWTSNLSLTTDVAADGAYDEVLKDDTVDGIIHTASPFHTRFSDPQELLEPAIRGTEGLLLAIVKLAPRVKRVVIISSYAAIMNPEKGNWPGHTYTEKDWNPVTMDQALHGSKITTYRASKTFAERAAWEFVSKHKPNFDLVTLCPPMVYGPIINAQTLSSINTSNEAIYKYLNGETKTVEPMFHPFWVDVRDVAAAHLSAYETPAAGGHRFFIVADEVYSSQDMVDALRKVSSFPPASDSNVDHPF